jgi:hypothetical protein
MSDTLPVETVAISDLRPHPRNYRGHPEPQLRHLIQSLREHGVYRNVVVARDGTILAGHGVVEAAKALQWTEIPVYRMDVGPEDPQALKILTGDNEIANLADINDRLLSEVLKDVNESGADQLLGTGFDPQMLAALVFASRPANEIENFDEAQAWVGMPEFERQPLPMQLIVAFRTEQDRQEFARLIGVDLKEKTKSTWWPPKAREELITQVWEG